MKAKRVMVYLFHDAAGQVDDYVVRAIRSLRPFVDHVLVVANGPLGDDGRTALEAVAHEVLQRRNTGMDVGGYRAALEHLGWRALSDLEELLLVNNTFLAPVRPWEPVFQAAATHPQASFWGLTEHAEQRPHPFLARSSMPRHIQSHFIAVRHRLLADPAFEEYWRAMPPIATYNDSVAHHESRFTSHFHDLGHTSFVAFPLETLEHPNPVLDEPEALMNAGCPVLKRRVLFHDPLHLDSRGVGGPAVVRAATAAGYPEAAVIGSVVRAAEPRILLASAGLTQIVHDDGAPAPQVPLAPGSPPQALCVHALARTDQDLDHLLGALTGLPAAPAVLACADERLAQRARARADERGLDAQVRTAALPRAGAAASLLVDAPDLLDGDGLVLRLAAGRGPDPIAAAALGACLDLFGAHPDLGVLVPTAPVLGSAALGHGWGDLRELAAALARQAGLSAPLDADSPVWSYGATTLVRTRALEPLTHLDLRAHGAALRGAHGAAPGDGARRLGQALERIIVVSAASQGLHCRQVLGRRAAEQYALLEYRYQALSALLPGDPETQLHHLQARCGTRAGVGARLRRGLEARSPRLAAALTPVYRGAVGAVARLTRRGGPHR